MDAVKIRTLLTEKFETLRARNHRYSLRSFATRLEMSSGALSEVMSGKRVFSVKKVQSLLRTRVFDPGERNELARAAGLVLAPEGRKKSPKYTKISSEQGHVIGEWWHFAILNLMRTRGFQMEPAWISKRLGLDRRIVDSAIFRLKELNFIREEGGKWIRTAEAFTTTDDQINLALQKGNQGMILLAARRLRTIPLDKRDVTSYVMAIHPDRLPEAKQAIRRLQDELSTLLEREDATEVYQLGIQLFPLSQ